MTQGFYKLEGDLLHGPNFVYGPTFELLKELKDTYTYPVEGWYWFDTLEAACNHFGLDITKYQPQEVLTSNP